MRVDEMQNLNIRCPVCLKEFDFPVPTDVLLEQLAAEEEMRSACPNCHAAMAITPQVQVSVNIPLEIGGSCKTGPGQGRAHSAPWPLKPCPLCKAPALAGR